MEIIPRVYAIKLFRAGKIHSGNKVLLTYHLQLHERAEMDITPTLVPFPYVCTPTTTRPSCCSTLVARVCYIFRRGFCNIDPPSEHWSRLRLWRAVNVQYQKHLKVITRKRRYLPTSTNLQVSFHSNDKFHAGFSCFLNKNEFVTVRPVTLKETSSLLGTNIWLAILTSFLKFNIMDMTS